jgi:hypothetical protein
MSDMILYYTRIVTGSLYVSVAGTDRLRIHLGILQSNLSHQKRWGQGNKKHTSATVAGHQVNANRAVKLDSFASDQIFWFASHYTLYLTK